MLAEWRLISRSDICMLNFQKKQPFLSFHVLPWRSNFLVAFSECISLWRVISRVFMELPRKLIKSVHYLHFVYCMSPKFVYLFHTYENGIIFFHPIFIEIQQCKWINRIFIRCKLVIRIKDMKEVYFFNKMWMFWAKFWFIKSIKKTQVFGNRNYFWDILVAFSVILLHLLFYIDRYDHESRGINSLKGMCWFHNIR